MRPTTGRTVNPFKGRMYNRLHAEGEALLHGRALVEREDTEGRTYWTLTPDPNAPVRARRKAQAITEIVDAAKRDTINRAYPALAYKPGFAGK